MFVTGQNMTGKSTNYLIVKIVAQDNSFTLILLKQQREIQIATGYIASVRISHQRPCRNR